MFEPYNDAHSFSRSFQLLHASMVTFDWSEAQTLTRGQSRSARTTSGQELSVTTAGIIMMLALSVANSALKEKVWDGANYFSFVAPSSEEQKRTTKK